MPVIVPGAVATIVIAPAVLVAVVIVVFIVIAMVIVVGTVIVPAAAPAPAAIGKLDHRNGRFLQGVVRMRLAGQ